MSVYLSEASHWNGHNVPMLIFLNIMCKNDIDYI